MSSARPSLRSGRCRMANNGITQVRYLKMTAIDQIIGTGTEDDPSRYVTSYYVRGYGNQKEPDAVRDPWKDKEFERLRKENAELRLLQQDVARGEPKTPSR